GDPVASCPVTTGSGTSSGASGAALAPRGPGAGLRHQRAGRAAHRALPAVVAVLRGAQGGGWFRLYLNYSALQDPANVPCFAEQMRSVYDPAADDYSNVTGYRDGETMFGAPYDFRYAAAPLPHPGVPVTSVVGVGVGTPERIVFPGDDFDVTPFVVAGDGDGVVNLVSAVAVETSWSHGGEDFRMVKVSNMSHNALLVDDRALEIIIREIQRAD
ncbi:hypothetical protein CFC21_034230, partial [Triticum aestivum]